MASLSGNLRIRRNGASNYRLLSNRYEWHFEDPVRDLLGIRHLVYRDMDLGWETAVLSVFLTHSAVPGVIESRFEEFARQWKEETAYSSSIIEIAMHPAYQRIIGMGQASIPLILRDLARQPDHWFWALTAITGENPIPDESKGRIPEMTQAWLTWGREKGFL